MDMYICKLGPKVLQNPLGGNENGGSHYFPPPLALLEAYPKVIFLLFVLEKTQGFQC
jgi:hypothetical protein